MGLASVIYNGYSVKAPSKFKYDSFLLRLSPTSPPIQAPNLTGVHFHRSHNRNHNQIFYSVSRNRRPLCLQVACAKGTQQEDDLSTSEDQRSGSQSYDDINNVSTSPSHSSIHNSEKLVEEHEIYTSSIKTVAFWVSTAVAFGIGVGLKEGVAKASEFFAGYILEQSLSVDNLFVFVLIFKYFKVPVMYQNRVLSYGIVGAVIFRLSLILLGTATVQRFESVNLLLAVILLYSSCKIYSFINLYKVLMKNMQIRSAGSAGIVGEDDDSDLANNFIVKTCQRFIPVTTYYDGNQFFTNQDGIWKATPLLLTVAVIEFSDIAFAVDSIPAVFGVTRDPLIVFSSNIFAILGLRSLYTLISEGMAELEYLQPSIAVVLGFIGSKMISDFFGFHVSTEASLGFVATSLGTGVVLSLVKKSE